MENSTKDFFGSQGSRFGTGMYSCGSMRTRCRMIREGWEDFSEYHIQQYFDKNYEMFLGVLQSFSRMDRGLTTGEQKELTFMLEALIDAKNILYEPRVQA